MTTNITAFCCFGKSTSWTKITLEKSHYYAGEPIKIRIECDNSVCPRDLIGFKLELKRRYQATAREIYHSGFERFAGDRETIVAKEEKGLGAHKKKTFEFELQIPAEDPPVGSLNRVPEEHRDMLKSFSPTVKGDWF